MRVALIQSDLVWEGKQSNLTNFRDKIRGLKGKADLIVLPEMFSTGFTMNPSNVAEPMSGETVRWMIQMAKEANAALCGSVVIEESGSFRNRCLFVKPSGEVVYYDKRHLFTLAGEHQTYCRGNEKVVVTYKDFRICLQVCYDLRFPAFSRYNDDYDMLIYVANWPEPRIGAWDALLRARAIENMCYVAGANRIGEDPNGNKYPGHSQVFDVFGNSVVETSAAEAIFITDVNVEDLREARKRFNFLEDRDQFTVN
ncbi:MAG: amidohydrolase [Flavobacterium sp.]|nr:MAG: amidohydrolase [Flavobacterium sp.]